MIKLSGKRTSWKDDFIGIYLSSSEFFISWNSWYLIAITSYLFLLLDLNFKYLCKKSILSLYLFSNK